MPKHRSLFEKLQRFGEMDDFSYFFTARAAFCNFLLQCSSKRQNMVVFSESCKLTKWMIFRAFSRDDALFATFFLKVIQKEKDIVARSKSCKAFAKSMIFCAVSRNEPLFQTFSLKTHQNAIVCNSCIVFAKIGSFLQLFPDKFIEKQRHDSLFGKLQRFDEMDDFPCFFKK